MRWTAAVAALLFSLLLMSASAQAQVFELRGGSSNMADTHGGSLYLYGQRYTARVGLGFTDEGPRVGFLLTAPIRGMQWDFGDQPIPFTLPTDMASNSYSFFGRGVGITRKGADSKLFIFAGGTSRFFSTPFVSSASIDEAAAAIFYEKQLTPSLRFTSHNIFSGRQTAIQSLEWKPRDNLTMAFAGGIGNSKSYWSSSLEWSHNWISVQAGYSRAARDFRRVRVRSPMLTESDRESVRVELRPTRWLGMSVHRQNYLLANPQPGTNPRIAVTGLSAWGKVAGTQLHGSLYRSQGAGGGADSMMVGARRRIFSRLEAGADYLASRPSNGPEMRAGVITLREFITPRFSVTQVISVGGGQKSVAFGGNFISNFATVGVEYQTVFTPLIAAGQTQFRQVLALTLRFQLPHDMQASLDTQISPLGETRYSAHMASYLYRGFGPHAGNRVPSNAFSDYIVQGRVLEVQGQPVSGAALLIDSELVFADSRGQFFLRRNKQREYPLEVALDQFMLPGKYEVVSAPSRVRTAREGQGETVEIVLRRLPARVPAPLPAGQVGRSQ